MPRRSRRLFETGYYDGDGNQTVSYGELLRRVFRRRRGRHHPQGANGVDFMDRNQDGLNADVDATEMWTPYMWTHVEPNRPQETGGDMTCSISVKDVIYFILFVLLTFGLAYLHVQLSTAQQEVQFLRQRMDTFAPLVDTIPNFALESQGARVVQHLSSETYWSSKQTGLLWDGIFYRQYSSKTQRQVIEGQSELRPGKCWCFPGNSGHLFVSLSHSISITHVTLGHIGKSQSPHGYISSAPRQFAVYGFRTTDEEGTHLGTLMYNQDGTVFQTFKLPNPRTGVLRYVKLEIVNNWGNIDNTCLYSFRVHGNLSSDI